MWRWHRAVAELRHQVDDVDLAYAPVGNLPLGAEGRHTTRLTPSQSAASPLPSSAGAVQHLAMAAFTVASDAIDLGGCDIVPLPTGAAATAASTAGDVQVDLVPRAAPPPLVVRPEPSLVVHVRWCNGIKEVHLESPTVVHNGLHKTAVRVVIRALDGRQWDHRIGPSRAAAWGRGEGRGVGWGCGRGGGRMGLGWDRWGGEWAKGSWMLVVDVYAATHRASGAMDRASGGFGRGVAAACPGRYVQRQADERAAPHALTGARKEGTAADTEGTWQMSLESFRWGAVPFRRQRMTCLPASTGPAYPTPPATPRSAGDETAEPPSPMTERPGPFVVQVGTNHSLEPCPSMRNIRIDASYLLEVRLSSLPVEHGRSSLLTGWRSIVCRRLGSGQNLLPEDVHVSAEDSEGLTVFKGNLASGAIVDVTQLANDGAPRWLDRGRGRELGWTQCVAGFLLAQGRQGREPGWTGRVAGLDRPSADRALTRYGSCLMREISGPLTVTLVTLKTHVHGRLTVPDDGRRGGVPAVRDEAFVVTGTADTGTPQMLKYRYAVPGTLMCVGLASVAR